jgi:hypothetical protein
VAFNSDLTTQKSATGVSTVDAQSQEHCSAFCYRITVVNTSDAGIELRNLVVTDTNFPGGAVDLSACFPTTLGVAGSGTASASCIIPAATICDDTTNIVTATAVGVVASTSDMIGNVSARDTNNVVIVPFNITCVKEASTNGTSWSNSVDVIYGTTTQVSYRVTVNNSSSLPLVVTINDGTFGCATITVPLAANSSVTTNLCTVPVTCPPDTNNVVNVSAIVDTASTNGLCVYTASGGGPVTDTTSCEASIHCVAPPRTGCTPGFWKNCTIHWQLTGLTTGQSVSSVFALGNCCTNLGTSSLLGALDFGGGPDVCGAARNLLRAAVAALLNASSPEVDYPFTTQEVITLVNAALQSCDRGTILTLASELDRDNNLGCRDANGNSLPCKRLPDANRVAPTRVTDDLRLAPTR